MINGEQLPISTIEIATTAEEADIMLRGLFPLEIDVKAYQDKIISDERRVVRRMMEDNSWLGLLGKDEEDRNRELGIGEHIFLATGSKTKLDIAEGVAKQFGFQIIPIDPEEAGQSEKTIQEELKSKDQVNQQYTTTLAEKKLTSITKHFKDPVIAMDTVVRVGQDILEKPSDVQELQAMLRRTSGQEIEIITGVALVQYTKNGMRLVTYQPVALKMQIKELTDEEINRYAEDNLENSLEIAGGVDYTTDGGRSLIDAEIPIEVSTPDLDHGTFKRFDTSKKVLISKDAASALDTYFKGAPKHLIAALVAQIKPVYEGIAFTHL